MQPLLFSGDVRGPERSRGQAYWRTGQLPAPRLSRRVGMYAGLYSTVIGRQSPPDGRGRLCGACTRQSSPPWDCNCHQYAINMQSICNQLYSTVIASLGLQLPCPRV